MSTFNTCHLWEDIPDPMSSFASGLDFLKSLSIGADFITLVNFLGLHHREHSGTSSDWGIAHLLLIL